MSTKRIIPCLDMKSGRVVKGVRFVQLEDAGDPVEQAVVYCKQGADEIVLLDISASHEGRKTAREVVRRVAEVVSVPFVVGGGIATLGDMDVLLRSGADKVSVNTAAVLKPSLITNASREFGGERVVVAIDAKRAAEGLGGWEVYILGGRRPTGKDALEWAREVERLGAGEILLTSIDKDGTKTGYDIDLTREISGSVDIPVIASGGAGKPFHVYLALTEGGAAAALMAGMLHYGLYSVREVKEYLKEKNVPVRL